MDCGQQAVIPVVPETPMPPPMPFDEEDLEEEAEDEEEGEHAAEYEAGEYWDCANCGEEPLFAATEGGNWAILGEAAAAITNAQLGRGEPGQAMCEDCLLQAGLDLEEAVQDELEGYCEECGELEEDCTCD